MSQICFGAGLIKPHEPSRDELQKLLTAARRNLKDAHLAGLSAESRLDIAYKAVMQYALLAMMAHGYRPSTNEPGHHALMIQSLPKTLGISGAERKNVGPAGERMPWTTSAKAH